MTSETYTAVHRAVAAWLAHQPPPMDTPVAREAAREARRTMMRLSMAMTLDRMSNHVVTDWDPELVEMNRFVHRVFHLRWRKGLGPVPEGAMVGECWMPWPVPDWALALAASGAPGSQWCPLINPALSESD